MLTLRRWSILAALAAFGVGHAGCTTVPRSAESMPVPQGAATAGPASAAEGASAHPTGRPPLPAAIPSRLAGGPGQAAAAARPQPTRPAGADQRTAADSPQLAAFLAELERSDQLDPQARGEIAAVLRAEPLLQTPLIRQYRALLAMAQRKEASRPSGSSPPAAGNAAGRPLPLASGQTTASRPTASVEGTASPAHPAAADRPTANQVPAANQVEEIAQALAAALRVEPPERPASTVVKASARQAASASSDSAVRTATANTAVRPPAADGPSGKNWHDPLDTAIARLKSEVSDEAKSERAKADQARLRLLYLAAGHRDEAVRSIPTLEPAMQDFWSKEMFGLATLLDADLISDSRHRAAESKRSLGEALARLGETTPLVVRNLAFVTKVDSFGVYEPFENYEFEPGQKVLLYAEVENYCSKQTSRGYHTAMRSSYQIFDSAGRRVVDYEFDVNEEYCRNPRRDFFTICEFTMPKNIYPGRHVLRLTITDANSDKIGQSSIEFQVKRRAE